MGDRVERLLEVHKAHIEWLLVLACLVHQYSEILDLISCPPALSESRLFICNFRFGLYSDPLQYRRVYDSRHLQADCQEPGPAAEPYAQQSTMG